MDHSTWVLGSELLGLWQRYRYSCLHSLTTTPHTYAHLFPGLHRCTWMMGLLGSFWNKEVIFLLGLHSGVFCSKHGALVAFSTPLWSLSLENHNPEELRRKGVWGSQPGSGSAHRHPEVNCSNHPYPISSSHQDQGFMVGGCVGIWLPYRITAVCRYWSLPTQRKMQEGTKLKIRSWGYWISYASVASLFY